MGIYYGTKNKAVSGAHAKAKGSRCSGKGYGVGMSASKMSGRPRNGQSGRFMVMGEGQAGSADAG